MAWHQEAKKLALRHACSRQARTLQEDGGYQEQQSQTFEAWEVHQKKKHHHLDH